MATPGRTQLLSPWQRAAVVGEEAADWQPEEAQRVELSQRWSVLYIFIVVIISKLKHSNSVSLSALQSHTLKWWVQTLRRLRHSPAVSLLPLALLIVPLGGEAFDRVDPHVQHPLYLFGLPVVIEGPGACRVDWRGKEKAQRAIQQTSESVMLIWELWLLMIN